MINTIGTIDIKEYREMLNAAYKEVHNSMPAALQRA